MQSGDSSVCVLVSLGRNPVSGRARRAPMDAMAVELALRLTGSEEEVTLLHAGRGDSPALRDYLGMGATRLTCFSVAPGYDPAPSLCSWLQRARPALILCGVAAETGEGSGMIPYHLAQALGQPLIPSVCDIAYSSAGLSFEQALPGGRRRRILAQAPVIATVSNLGPTPRLPTLARARRGVATVLPGIASPDDRAGWQERPARPRPARILPAATGSAAERLRALRGDTALAGSEAAEAAPMTGLSADEAASRIIAYLQLQGLLGLAAGSAAALEVARHE